MAIVFYSQYYWVQCTATYFSVEVSDIPCFVYWTDLNRWHLSAIKLHNAIDLSYGEVYVSDIICQNIVRKCDLWIRESIEYLLSMFPLCKNLLSVNSYVILDSLSICKYLWFVVNCKEKIVTKNLWYGISYVL